MGAPAAKTMHAGALLTDAALRLAAAGVENARREARLMLAAALRQPQERLFAHPDMPVTADAGAEFDGMIARRVGGEPLSRILGLREFWSLPFRLGPDTLDPRPDSETLVDAALRHIGDRAAALRVLDFGTGSGCLLLALLSELPAARGLGVDLSTGAVALAARNARDLGLAARADFAASDWDAALAGPESSRAWDVILSNPPYVDSAAFEDLDLGVANYDPRLALDGGCGGLKAYRRLLPGVKRLLAPDGIAVLELGAGQAEAVTALGESAKLRVCEGACDLAGLTRALVLRHA